MSRNITFGQIEVGGSGRFGASTGRSGRDSAFRAPLCSRHAGRDGLRFHDVRDAEPTARGGTDGNIRARSHMCAAPSLRIMLWPINTFIRPPG
jgi:hypothetical protein